MKNRALAIAVMISSSLFAVFGQRDSATQFEMASIRPHASAEPTRIGIRTSAGRVSGAILACSGRRKRHTVQR